MDKLIKDVIKDRRIFNRLDTQYKYIGELLVVDEETLVRRILGINRKSLILINNFLVKAGYGCVGSRAGEAHRLPSTVLHHMAMKAAEREDRAREEAEAFFKEHGCTRDEFLARALKEWEEEEEED